MLNSRRVESSDIGLFCPDCGYDLRGIASERCPECGWVIDRTLLGASAIPWVGRERIGRWRAYWRTVWMATFSNKRLAMESVRPIEWRDARRFATITML